MTETAGFFDETYDAEALPDPLPASPFPKFIEWFDEARAAKDIPNPNAMCLSTVSADGQASSRMVLCKEIFAEDGVVVFYTNYDSRKASELEDKGRGRTLLYYCKREEEEEKHPLNSEEKSWYGVGIPRKERRGPGRHSKSR